MSTLHPLLILAGFLAYVLVVAVVARLLGRSLGLTLVGSVVLAPVAVAVVSRAAHVSDFEAVATAFAVPTLFLVGALLPRRAAAAE